jgi:xanthine dehydrogenase iron-sulfur cluster and FAD-binding subunit A
VRSEGNLCRCTGYVNIVASVQAAKLLREAANERSLSVGAGRFGSGQQVQRVDPALLAGKDGFTTTWRPRAIAHGVRALAAHATSCRSTVRRQVPGVTAVFTSANWASRRQAAAHQVPFKRSTART